MSGPAAERRPRRLSPLTPLVRSFILVVAVLFTSWDDLLSGHLGPFAAILLAVLVAGGVYGFASWLRTRYWIEADELRVDTGVVSRQSRRIRVDRLQGIDIAQPFVARVFGLAELRMDVAGGGAREGSLAFLPLAEAQELRETLLARRDVVRESRRPPGTATPGSPDGMAAPSDVPRRPAWEREVARLDLVTLLVSMVLSLDAIALVVGALLLWVAFLTTGAVVFAPAAPVVLGFALTQLRKLSAYYGFTVSESSVGLQVRRGLFERNTATITLARVQGVVVTEPLLWRLPGWAKLQVAVAGSSGGDSDGGLSATVVMPVAPRAQVLALARTLLAESGGPDPDAVALSGPPVRARWVAPIGRRFLAGGLGEHLAVSRRGLLARRLDAVPHARVQSLQLHQGPWQRRLGLADLVLDSPPSPVRVRMRHRDAREARALLEREQALTREARAHGGHGAHPAVDHEPVAAPPV